MDFHTLIRRLNLSKKYPNLGISFSNEEVATILATFLEVNTKTKELIEKGKIKGKDGWSPTPGKDFLTVEQQEAFMNKALSEALGKLNNQIQEKLATLDDEAYLAVDGEDAEITEEMIDDIAERAAALIQLPNFQELVETIVDTAITANPEAIRNALELLQEDDRLDISAVGGLTERLQQINDNVTLAARNAGGTSRNLIRQMAWTGGTDNMLTVSATAPANPKVNDLWIQI